MSKYLQGKFKPNNPKKYAGDPKNIVYRSSWELKFMMDIDKDPSIFEWGSEEMAIGYFDPVTKKFKRYFPDFVYKKKTKQGLTEVYMAEIKPNSQTKVPNGSKTKSTRKMITEAAAYVRNQAKWEAATKFCEKKGWKFVVLDEYNLGIVKKGK